MKIIHLIDSAGFGGAERYIIDLTRTLIENHKIDVEIVTFYMNEKLSLKAQEYNIPISFLSSNRKLSSFKLMKLIKELSNRNKDTIIHTHGYHANILTRLAYLFNSTKLVTTVHSTFKYWTHPIKRFVYSFLDRYTSFRNQKIVVVSDYIASYYRTFFNSKKLVTIYNGVDTTLFYSSNNLDRDSYQLVTVGNLNEVKNHLTMVKAMMLLPNRINDKQIDLLLIGEGSQREKIEEFIDLHQLTQRVKLLGYREVIPEQLKRCVIYLSASTDESFGLSIVEAMMSGLPVISSKVGGVPEIISDNKTGVFYEPATDEAKLSEALLKLLENDLFRNQIAVQGQTHAIENFSLQKQAEQMNDLYQELLKND